MTEIRNTTDAMMNDPVEPLLLLAVGMANHGDPSEFIEAQERQGQTQLVNSDRLPTEVADEGGDEPYLALGFTFGAPDPGDRLFRPATLPPGWSRRATDHSMGSVLVDEHGRTRVSIFYKAAFYDRSANMYLVSRYAYLTTVLYDNAVPVLDDVWLTAATARNELARIAERCDKDATEADDFAKRGSNAEYWETRAAEHRAQAAKARALADSLPVANLPLTAEVEQAEAASSLSDQSSATRSEHAATASGLSDRG